MDNKHSGIDLSVVFKSLEDYMKELADLQRSWDALIEQDAACQERKLQLLDQLERWKELLKRCAFEGNLPSSLSAEILEEIGL